VEQEKPCLLGVCGIDKGARPELYVQERVSDVKIIKEETEYYHHALAKRRAQHLQEWVNEVEIIK
jgi:hypothetical protein